MATSARHLVFAVIFLLVTLAFIYSNYDPPYASPLVESAQKPSKHTTDVTPREVLQFIYNPNKFSIDTPSSTYNGTTYKIPARPTYKSPLGKQICILDVDTRPFNAEHEIFHGPDFDWSEMKPHSGGVMNHYMYAQMHGYDYKFLQLPPPSDRHPTWVKVRGLMETLKDYKFIIFLDSDALFNQMHIPVEWLLNYWSIHPTTSLAMAVDPPGPQNNDTRGRRYLNTGFIIAQNNAKTYEILEALDKCPSEARYKGCAEFKDKNFNEQGAFGSFVRYDYEEYIKELPCDEANGEWDLELCKGVFVQHMWWRTMNLRSRFGDTTLQAFMARMHEKVLEEKRSILET